MRAAPPATLALRDLCALEFAFINPLGTLMDLAISISAPALIVLAIVIGVVAAYRIAKR